MDVLENMAYVRSNRGLPPIDPTKIEGDEEAPEIRVDITGAPGEEEYRDPDPDFVPLPPELVPLRAPEPSAP